MIEDGCKCTRAPTRMSFGHSKSNQIIIHALSLNVNNKGDIFQWFPCFQRASSLDTSQ